jgi:hypothetical protein
MSPGLSVAPVGHVISVGVPPLLPALPPFTDAPAAPVPAAALRASEPAVAPALPALPLGAAAVPPAPAVVAAVIPVGALGAVFGALEPALLGVPTFEALGLFVEADALGSLVELPAAAGASLPDDGELALSPHAAAAATTINAEIVLCPNILCMTCTMAYLRPQGKWAKGSITRTDKSAAR